LKQLRQFVQAEPPEEPADRGDPWIVSQLEQHHVPGVPLLVQAGLGVHLHRPELDHPEHLPVQADAVLPKEHRTLTGEFDGRRAVGAGELAVQDRPARAPQGRRRHPTTGDAHRDRLPAAAGGPTTRALGERLRYAQLADPNHPTGPATARPDHQPTADSDGLRYDTDLVALAADTPPTATDLIEVTG